MSEEFGPGDCGPAFCDMTSANLVKEQRAEIERLKRLQATYVRDAGASIDQLTRERDEAREAARWIWRTRTSGMSESAAIASRYPWLEEVSDE